MDQEEEEMVSSHMTDEGGLKMHPTVEAVLKGSWPFEKALWHSSPASVGLAPESASQVSPRTLFYLFFFGRGCLLTICLSVGIILTYVCRLL